MANVKFSAFTSGSAIADADIFVGLQGGVNVKWTGAQLKSYALTGYVGQSSITTTGTLTSGGTGVGFTLALGTSTLTGDLPFANLTQGSARSVLGVTGNSTADLASIQGTADQVLRINSAGTALAFGTVNLASANAVSGVLPAANGGFGPSSVLGTIITDNWTNLTSWTKVGAQTFTVSGNALSIVGGSPGAITFSNYYLNSAYGNSNLENFVITDNITVGTIGANSFRVGYGFQPQAGTILSQGAVIVGFLMDSTNKGKIGFYFANSATNAVVSSSALPLNTGDATTIKIRQIKDRLIVTWTNNTTTPKVSITVSYDFDLTSTTANPTMPNSFQYGIYALGGTHTSTGIYTVASETLKTADYLVTACSILKGYTNGTIAGRAVEILNNNFATSMIVNGGCFEKFEDLTTAEILAHTPTNIIIDGSCAINNLGAGQTQAQAFTALQNLVTVFTGAGYVVGTTLFILTSIPYTSDLTTFNASIRSTYATTGVIDVFYPLWSGTSFTLNTAYASGDGIHLNVSGNAVLVNTISNFLALRLSKVFNLTYGRPVIYSSDNHIRPITGANYITTNGKIGLGITPTSPLHISNIGGGAAKFIQLDNTTTTSYSGIDLLYANTLNAQIILTGHTQASIGPDKLAFLSYIGGIELWSTGTLKLKTGGSFTDAISIDTSQISTFGGTIKPRAGTATAGTSPILFTSGISLTVAVAGAMEFTTDDLFFTITTGTARKRFLFADAVGGLTSGTFPVTSTNGRLIDSAFTSTSLTSGTYTPTLTNVTNVTASTAYVTGYYRIGAMVTVFGKVDIDATLAASSATELGISLPVASNLAAEEDLGGAAISDAVASLTARIKADTTNDRASVVFKALSLNNDSYSFEFSYQIK